MPCRVENIVRKGEIAFYKQFLLFSQCFPQLYIFSASKCGIVWEWIRVLETARKRKNGWFPAISPILISQSSKKVFQLSHYSSNSLQNKIFFGLDQIQSICRRQMNCSLSYDFCLQSSRKHCGKRRKCWLPAFSPFPTMFSTVLFPRVIKIRNCVVKS